MRELERDVRLQLLGDEAVEDALVLRRDGRRARRVGDRLAEERRVRVQPGVVQPAQHGDALVEGLAGDEARRADAHAVLLHEPLEPGALGRAQDGCARERRAVVSSGQLARATAQLMTDREA